MPEAKEIFTFGKDQKRKSLSRYFIDEKIPRQLREEIPLVADGSHIVWIVGRRISEYYKIKEINQALFKSLSSKEKEMIPMENIRVMISEEDVNKRIAEMGAQISEDYAGKEIHLIAILKGSVFACELAKRITIPVTIDFYVSV